MAPTVRKGGGAEVKERCRKRTKETRKERKRDIHTKPSKQNIKQDNFYSRPKIL